jgi:hypothetical protein
MDSVAFSKEYFLANNVDFTLQTVLWRNKKEIVGSACPVGAIIFF